MKSKICISIMLLVLAIVSISLVRCEVNADSIIVNASDIIKDSNYGSYYIYELKKDTILNMDQSIEISGIKGNNYDLTIEGTGTLSTEDIDNVKNYVQKDGTNVYIKSTFADITVNENMTIEEGANLKFEEFLLKSSCPVNIKVGDTFTSFGTVKILTYAWNGIEAKNVIINGGTLNINSRHKSCINAEESICFNGGNVDLKFNTYEDSGGIILFAPLIKVAADNKITVPQNYIFGDTEKTSSTEKTRIVGKSIYNSDGTKTNRVCISPSSGAPAIDSSEGGNSGGDNNVNIYNINVVPDSTTYNIELGSTFKTNFTVTFNKTKKIKLDFTLYNENGTVIETRSRIAYSTNSSESFSNYFSKYKDSPGIYHLVTKIYYYESSDWKLLGDAPLVTIYVSDPNNSGASNSGSTTGGVPNRGGGQYANEWVDGRWYDANGNNTYSGIMSWKSNSTGWWIEDSSGWYPVSQWQKIDGYWYYFNSAGYMASNEWIGGYWINGNGTCTYGGTASWKVNSKGWWYEDTTGWYPYNQWQKIDEKWYYFSSDGMMVTNKQVEGYWIGSDGVCQ